MMAVPSNDYLLSSDPTLLLPSSLSVLQPDPLHHHHQQHHPHQYQHQHQPHPQNAHDRRQDCPPSVRQDDNIIPHPLSPSPPPPQQHPLQRPSNPTPPTLNNHNNPNTPQLLAPQQPQIGKNGKPLARCSYCGMTFKKLEHCQRHERTHTLARPYSCSVCSKTFARQDTLNRHLRLHSRPDGRGTSGKPNGQANATLPAQPTLAGASKPPPSPGHPSSNAGVGLPSPYAASPLARRRANRERGLSLSALEHVALLGDGNPSCHLAVPASGSSSGARQSISLPLHWSQHQAHHTVSQPQQAFMLPHQHAQQHQPPHRQPSGALVSVAGYAADDRRGSWCAGEPGFGEVVFGTSQDTGAPPTTRQTPQLALGAEDWGGLGNAFGLVGVGAGVAIGLGGIGPVPMSAPATCTDWSSLGIGMDGSGGGSSSGTEAGSANATASGARFEANWTGAGLGRLEEEEIVKVEEETSGPGTQQLILSSPSLPDSVDAQGTSGTPGRLSQTGTCVGGMVAWTVPRESSQPFGERCSTLGPDGGCFGDQPWRADVCLAGFLGPEAPATGTRDNGLFGSGVSGTAGIGGPGGVGLEQEINAITNEWGEMIQLGF